MRSILGIVRAVARPNIHVRKLFAADDVLVVDQPVGLQVADIAPPDAKSVRVDFDARFQVTDLADVRLKSGNDCPLTPVASVLSVMCRHPSTAIDDLRLGVSFRDKKGHALSRHVLKLTCLRVCLDVDANRDGKVDDNSSAKAGWTWGPLGSGAILLVNNDHDYPGYYAPKGQSDRLDRAINGQADLADLSPAVIRAVGPPTLPPGCALRLQTTDAAAQRVRVFGRWDRGARELLGPGTSAATLLDLRTDLCLAIEALQYPDRTFTGLITLELVLARGDEQLFCDRVVFRVAPWIMPSTLSAPEEVYVCQITRRRSPDPYAPVVSSDPNLAFLRRLRPIVRRAGATLTVLPPTINRGDRWIQDEIELGYSEASPDKYRPVVLDSPRDRDLDPFPKNGLLGPDFGYVTRSSPDLKPNSLDSFGNLEVSPPVSVNGLDYPLGRIIFGGALPTVHAGRRAMTAIREFLYGQAVQPPIEVFSDWLTIGHVDEFMTFVPAATQRAFRLVLASPRVCYRILTELARSGHEAAVLFAGKNRLDPNGRRAPAQTTVAELLADRNLAAQNERYQAHLDWNSDVLRTELGLEKNDVVELPQLYAEFKSERAVAYYPNVCNILVLGRHLVVPKPYGPKIRGRCQFEVYLRKALGPEVTCHFIDDWNPYFLRWGGIHCGTNVRRMRHPVRWWETRPPGSVDV